MTDRVLIFSRGLESRPITITDDEARAIPTQALPAYTVLVPAYHEPEVIADLIGSIDTLEYPRDKLQVQLLLETDDDRTIEARRMSRSPTRSRFVLVPPSSPARNQRHATTGCICLRRYRHDL